MENENLQHRSQQQQPSHVPIDVQLRSQLEQDYQSSQENVVSVNQQSVQGLEGSQLNLQQHQSDLQGSQQSQHMIQQQQEQQLTFWMSCAAGNLERCNQFMNNDPSIVNQPDDGGFYAVQWAALNNQIQVLQFLIKRGADINLGDKNTGQTALHWAATRGCLPCVEILMRCKANLEQADSMGYTPIHIATQYNQAQVVLILATQWCGSVDVADLQQRTPLHWAAYRGHINLVNLLIFMNARLTTQDIDGCTPLHHAAVIGQYEVAQALLRGGSGPCLEISDNMHQTPLQIAEEKQQRKTSLILRKWAMEQKIEGQIGFKNEKTIFNRQVNKILSFIKYVSKLQMCPVTWMFVLSLLYIFLTQVSGPDAIKIGWYAPALSWIVTIFAVSGLFFLYMVTKSDPGFIEKGQGIIVDNKNELIAPLTKVSELDDPSPTYLFQRFQDFCKKYPALFTGHYDQICVSCKIIKPLRSKHCVVLGRCIEVYDHFCPWVGNTIGKNNRHYFFVFLWTEFIAQLIAEVLAIIRLVDIGGEAEIKLKRFILVIVFLTFNAFIFIAVLMLSVTQSHQAFQNATTNELANWHRLKYLQDSMGRYHNPFNHGWKSNLWEFFHPSQAGQSPQVLPPKQVSAQEKKDIESQEHTCKGATCQHGAQRNNKGPALMSKISKQLFKSKLVQDTENKKDTLEIMPLLGKKRQQKKKHDLKPPGKISDQKQQA